MMRRARRAGVATIIATLIMIAAAALFTSIMLYWGLSFQGQAQQNFGQALFRSNNQAAEDLSIDNIYFGVAATTPKLYTATLYVRNFGDVPVAIAGIHIKNLQSGASPPGIDCEVIAPTNHPVIVARSMGPQPGGVVLSAQQCSPQYTFPVCWEGQSVSVQVSTAAGTSIQKSYVIPTPSITVQSVTFTESASTPSAAITIKNNGPVAMSISSISLAGNLNNGGSGFTGSVTATIPCGGSATAVASDGSTWTISGSYTSIDSGASATITLRTGSAGSNTKIGSGNIISVTAMTTGGSFSAASFTTP